MCEEIGGEVGEPSSAPRCSRENGTVGRGDQGNPTAAKEKVLGRAVHCADDDGDGGGDGGGGSVEGGKGKRGPDTGEAKGDLCPAWTCASLHGRLGDSLSVR